MDDDDSIARAVSIGEKNQRTKELIRNWCRHARVEKHGGTGLIEMQTGLPIGHYGLACEYAPAGGSFTWALADAALEFYDRHCAGCVHRDPVGLPNLSILVQERDALRAQRDAEKSARVTLEEQAHERRRQARAALRDSLQAATAGLVDDLEELDDAQLPAERRRHIEQGLLATARLDASVFSTPLLEYCFELLESREPWFDAVGLQLLRHLAADPKRLVALALKSLAQHRSIPIAAVILAERATIADPMLIADALPALVDLAQPEHRISSNQEEVTDATPLTTLYQTHAQTVENAIRALLDERHPYRVNCAARTIVQLTSTDGSIPFRFVRALAVKLVRANLLIDRRETGFAGEDQVINQLQMAIAFAVLFNPDAAIAQLSRVMEGAPAKGEARALRVYHLLLDARVESMRNAEGRVAARAALRELLTAASTRTEDEIRREVQSALSHIPQELNWLAAREATAILGTAILLDDRIQAAWDEQPKNTLEFLDRTTRANGLQNVQRNLIRWVAHAAEHDDATAEQYLEVYQRVDERHQRVRGEMVRRFNRLMSTPHGIARTLPVLYAAMVGASSLVRAAAGTAIGKLDTRVRNDVPSLVNEAFALLFWDPYVLAHKAAIQTLERGVLPDSLRGTVEQALVAWIEHYATDGSDPVFLYQAIEIYLRRFGTNEHKRREISALAIAALQRMETYELTDKLRSLFHKLKDTDGYIDLILKALADWSISDYRSEDLCALLERLDGAQLLPFAERLQTLAVSTPIVAAATSTIELLMHAGLWTQAAAAAQSRMEAIPSTIEMRHRRLYAELFNLAIRCEEAIAGGDWERFAKRRDEWHGTLHQTEAN